MISPVFIARDRRKEPCACYCLCGCHCCVFGDYINTARSGPREERKIKRDSSVLTESRVENWLKNVQEKKEKPDDLWEHIVLKRVRFGVWREKMKMKFWMTTFEWENKNGILKWTKIRTQDLNRLDKKTSNMCLADTTPTYLEHSHKEATRKKNHKSL